MFSLQGSKTVQAPLVDFTKEKYKAKKSISIGNY